MAGKLIEGNLMSDREGAGVTLTSRIDGGARNKESWSVNRCYEQSGRDLQAVAAVMRGLAIALTVLAGLSGWSANAEDTSTTKAPLWRDPSQPLEARVKDLVGRMTLEEKARQVCNVAPPIPRLGLPAYNYWNECLHGVGRNGIATVFPQAIGMAASFDPALLHQVADGIATEARAKNREFAEAHDGNSANYTGLTFWSPNINIFRDPRWGRGQETYGEDPFLTGRMAVAYIRGLQGDDPKYVKAMACAKHSAVHSGPEILRHNFNAEPPERDFYETYLPQFEAAVKEGHVGAVMGAYKPDLREALLQRVRCCWTPCCGTSGGSRGTCCRIAGRFHDFFYGHEFSPTVEAAAATAVRAGCDLCCGTEYQRLGDAVNDGLLNESELNTARWGGSWRRGSGWGCLIRRRWCRTRKSRRRNMIRRRTTRWRCGWRENRWCC